MQGQYIWPTLVSSQAVKTNVHLFAHFCYFFPKLELFHIDYRRILLTRIYIAPFKINVGKTLEMLFERWQFCQLSANIAD